MASKKTLLFIFLILAFLMIGANKTVAATDVFFTSDGSHSSPDTFTVEPGEEFTAYIKITSASQDFYGADIDLDYNTSLLDLQKVREGWLFETYGCDSNFATTTTDAGLLRIEGDRATCDPVNIYDTSTSTNQVIYDLYFKATSTGSGAPDISIASTTLKSSSTTQITSANIGTTSVDIITDNTPPTITVTHPTSSLSANTSTTTLSATTDENATCKYATSSGVSYANMSNTFTTTGGVDHNTELSGLENGQSYTYYVRCEDEAGNTNSSDTSVNFSVEQPPPQVKLEPSSISTTTSKQIGVDMNIYDVSDLGTVSADITYDPSVLDYTGFATGTDVASANWNKVNIMENATGTLTLLFDKGAMMNSPGTALTGDVNIAALEFDTVATGTSELGYANTGLSDTTMQPISADWNTGSVEVVEPSPIPADLDNNGQVGPSEFGIIISNWKNTDNPGNADLTGDGVVNTQDLGVLMSNWGRGQ